MAQYDDLNTRQIWIVGIISAVLTGITVLAVQVLYYAMLGIQQDNMAEAEYTTSILSALGLSGVTLKGGAYISVPDGDFITSITLASGSIIAYNK